MLIRLYFTLLLLLLAIGAWAQLPQFTAGAATGGNYFPLGSTDGKGSRVQLLYKASDFVALPPAGTITRIYFKADNSTESEGLAAYNDLSLRMAATEFNALPPDGSSFSLPMATVFEAAQYQARFNRGQWLSFTLQQPFSYSDTANLVIEISVSQASAMRYLGFANSSGTRRVWGKTGSNRADGSDSKLYALGLDISAAPAVAATVPAPPLAREDETIPLPSTDTETKQTSSEISAPIVLSQTESSRITTTVDRTAPPARRNGNRWFVAGTALLAALGVGTLLPLLPRTRRLASWAMRNPRKAKGWLFGLQFLGSVAALYTGIKLYDYGVTSSDASTTALLAMSTIATLLYPRRNSSGDIWKGYVRQKLTGGLVVASGFGLLAGIGNHCASQQDFCRPASYVITQMDSEHYERTAPAKFYDSGDSVQANKGWKVLATVGAVILLIAMLCAVTVLACAVFCVIALDATATSVIIVGAVAGGAVGAAGGFGSVKLFLYLKRLIWGR